MKLPNPLADHEVLEALWGPLLRVNPDLNPKMGTGKQVDVNQFLSIYRTDPLYGQIGFASESVYAAHRALTRLTSLYRNVGTGTEAMVKLFIERCLGIPAASHMWGYEYSFNGSARKRHLDGAIRFRQVRDVNARRRLRRWVANVDPTATGVVLEVREGYKSSDAKRMNGDKDAVLAARADGLVPVMLVLSNQIDVSIVATYLRHGWTVLAGADAYRFCARAFGIDPLEVMGRNPEFMERVRQHVNTLI